VSRKRALRSSMASTKRKGERGSPCRSSRAWQMCWPGLPLSKISNAYSQLVQRRENPMKARSSSKNGQLTVSKALAMSIFRRTHGCLRVWSSFADDCTALKLSWIALPLINALWFGCTSWFMNGLTVTARTLVTSLQKLCKRLMGL
jgi:hypothetical protein